MARVFISASLWFAFVIVTLYEPEPKFYLCTAIKMLILSLTNLLEAYPTTQLHP